MLNKRKQREQERQRQLNNDYSNPNEYQILKKKLKFLKSNTNKTNKIQKS